MDRQINAAVVGAVRDEFLGERPVIPQETCVFIACDSEFEAHYLCALLNSATINFIARSHSVEGGKGFGTPGLLEFLPLRRFQLKEALPQQLADLSREAHRLAAIGKNYSACGSEIDRLAAELLNGRGATLEGSRGLQPTEQPLVQRVA
jgi:hypothetical protein